MKNTLLLLSLICLVDFAFGQGDAPPMLQGQNQTSKTVAPLIKLPASQVTKVTGGALIETGNKNILEDPSFEAAVRPTSWVALSGSLTAETTVVIDGKKSVVSVFSSSTTVTQDSTLYSAQFADGPQGLAMVRVKTSQPGVKLCSRQANVTSTTNCMTHSGSGKWELLKVPFILGGTSNGISIAGSSGTSGNVYIDDAFVGPADLKVDTDFIGNRISWASPTTPTNLGTATGSYDYYYYDRVGDSVEIEFRWTSSAAGSGASGIVFPLPPGLTVSTADTLPGYGMTYNLLGSASTFKAAVVLYNGVQGITVVKPDSSSNTTGADVLNGSQFRVKIKLPVVGWSGSTAVYSSTNKDTDWVTCNFSTLAWQGLGTVTSSLRCKRQGSDLLLNGRVTIGTVAGSIAQIPLPLWNGTQLVSKNSSIITDFTSSGRIIRNIGVANTPKDYIPLIVAAGSYFNIGYPEYALAASPLAAYNGNALFNSSEVLSIDNVRIPIEGWENSNVIVGSFDGLEKCTDSFECEDTYSALVTTTTGAHSNENLDFITSCTAANPTVCTFKTGLFTVAPNCTVDIQSASAVIMPATSTATTVTIKSILSTDGTNIATMQGALHCQKNGADYLGKTAKAVASDANIRSIGATGVDIQSVLFGSGANCDTACSTGTCSICTQIGSKITSVTFNATGQYKLNGIDGTKYNCTGSGGGANFVPAQHSKSSSTSSYAFINTGSGASNVNAATVSVMCIGVP
jgi:hypothetical protein